jgi:peptide chain release factor subunit 1
MTSVMTWDSLRDLAGFRSEKGCAISVYLDLDPRTAPTLAEVETRARSVLDRIRNGAGNGWTHEQRVAVREDVERIRRYIDEELDRDGSLGLVVFCSSLDNLWRPLRLTEPVPDGLKLGRELYLAPLVSLIGRGEGALVAVVGRERGDVFQLRSGRLELLDERFDEQPRQHDQGGWSQANFQRHIENLVHEHLKAFAEQLDARVRKLRPPDLVLVCAEELRPDVTDLLSRETQNLIVGWTQVAAHAGPTELLEAVRPLIEQARAHREEQVVARWHEERGRGGRAAAGWEETIEAASDGRVEWLLCREGATRAAAQCPACGRGSLKGGTCPLDGTQMEPHEDALDLAVHRTLGHGGWVVALRAHNGLDPVGGIGALLRY